MHGLDGQFDPLRRGCGGLVSWLILHRGELGLDAGEVFLGVGKGLCVAEGLPEALLSIGDGLLGFFQVFAGLVEKGVDAADAVLDPLHKPESGVQERLLRQRESRAGHLGQRDRHIEVGEPGAGFDVDVETGDAADDPEILVPVPRQPLQPGVAHPRGKGVRGFGAGVVVARAERDAEPVAARVDHPWGNGLQPANVRGGALGG